MCSPQESINFTRKFSCQKAAPGWKSNKYITNVVVITNEKLLVPGKGVKIFNWKTKLGLAIFSTKNMRWLQIDKI